MSVDGRTDKEDVVQVPTGLPLSHYKKEQSNAICSNVDAQRVSQLSEVKPEKERQIPYDITYMWNLNYGTTEPICKTDQTHRHQTHSHQRGDVGRGMDWEFVVEASYYVQNG